MADYTGVLTDLRSRREALIRELRELETAIAALERLAGDPTVAIAIQSMSQPTVTKGTFDGLTLPQAVDKYMRMMNRPLITRQVVDALRAGGVPADAKSFANQVYNALHRMSGENGVFRREGNAWTLRPAAEQHTPYQVGSLLRDTH